MRLDLQRTYVRSAMPTSSAWRGLGRALHATPTRCLTRGASLHRRAPALRDMTAPRLAARAQLAWRVTALDPYTPNYCLGNPILEAWGKSTVFDDSEKNRAILFQCRWRRRHTGAWHTLLANVSAFSSVARCGQLLKARLPAKAARGGRWNWF
ncbi:hypothetical protein T484DRAFT_1758469 [Baffinella frigidus]|nr:hypothetical protein T484DRAFT_1758469 [Cryptophyta sp. CCMP2293]